MAPPDAANSSMASLSERGAAIRTRASGSFPPTLRIDTPVTSQSKIDQERKSVPERMRHGKNDIHAGLLSKSRRQRRRTGELKQNSANGSDRAEKIGTKFRKRRGEAAEKPHGEKIHENAKGARDGQSAHGARFSHRMREDDESSCTRGRWRWGLQLFCQLPVARRIRFSKKS
jgi:hypothetical protein